MIPKLRNMVRNIRMPYINQHTNQHVFPTPPIKHLGTALLTIPILPPRRRMHIQNRIYPLLCAEVHNPIQPLETFRFQHPWVHVVFEMSVVEGHADAIESEGFVEFGIGGGEEVFEELWLK